MRSRVIVRAAIVLVSALVSLAVPRNTALTHFGFPLKNYDRAPLRYASVRIKQIGYAAYLEETWQSGRLSQFERLSQESDDRWLRLAPGIIGAFSPRAAAINAVTWIGVSALCLKLWALRRQRSSGVNCSRCGYDLTGNVSGRCPECGAPR